MVGDSGQRHRLSKSKDAEAREARVQVKDGGEGLKLDAVFRGYSGQCQKRETTCDL